MSEERIKKTLPEGWRWGVLSDLCKQDRQIHEPFSIGADTLPYYSLEHIEAGTGRILKSPKEKIEDEGKSTTFRFDEKHVLYGKLRPYLNKVALPQISGRCTTEIIPLLPNEDVDREFLAWLLRRRETVEFAMKGKTGSRMPRADINSLLKLPVPIPSFPEQKRLAGVLQEQMAAVDKARAAAEARLEAVKALPGAYLRRVFPNPGEVLPDGWRWVRLGDFSIKVGSGVTPDGGQSVYITSGVPLIRSQNVYLNRFVEEGLVYITKEQDELMNGSRVQVGDILLNITGASIGRVCVIPERVCPANVNQHVSILRFGDDIDPLFLSYYLSTPDFQRHIIETQAGATRQALTKAMIEDFQIPFTSLTIQKRVVDEVSKKMKAIEILLDIAVEELKAINTLPAALLRRAFNGEL